MAVRAHRDPLERIAAIAGPSVTRRRPSRATRANRGVTCRPSSKRSSGRRLRRSRRPRRPAARIGRLPLIARTRGPVPPPTPWRRPRPPVRRASRIRDRRAAARLSRLPMRGPGSARPLLPRPPGRRRSGGRPGRRQLPPWRQATQAWSRRRRRSDPPPSRGPRESRRPQRRPRARRRPGLPGADAPVAAPKRRTTRKASTAESA